MSFVPCLQRNRSQLFLCFLFRNDLFGLVAQFVDGGGEFLLIGLVGVVLDPDGAVVQRDFHVLDAFLIGEVGFHLLDAVLAVDGGDEGHFLDVGGLLLFLVLRLGYFHKV